jgi:small basic protein (TIGR04137 family)
LQDAVTPLQRAFRLDGFVVSKPSVLGKNDLMSQHSSLRASSNLGAKRNVLKRFERIAILKSRNQWKDGERVTGLRKTKPPE